jgi:hypothetical protein
MGENARRSPNTTFEDDDETENDDENTHYTYDGSGLDETGLGRHGRGSGSG